MNDTITKYRAPMDGMFRNVAGKLSFVALSRRHGCWSSARGMFVHGGKPTA